MNSLELLDRPVHADFCYRASSDGTTTMVHYFIKLNSLFETGLARIVLMESYREPFFKPYFLLKWFFPLDFMPWLKGKGLGMIAHANLIMELARGQKASPKTLYYPYAPNEKFNKVFTRMGADPERVYTLADIFSLNLEYCRQHNLDRYVGQKVAPVLLKAQ